MSDHLAQAYGCGSGKSREKSQLGLKPAGNGAASCATFLLRGFVDMLPYLHVRVDVGCYGKLFQEILVWHYAGADIGDTSWCHSLPISSHPYVRQRFM